jgi:hypothetical protein
MTALKEFLKQTLDNGEDMVSDALFESGFDTEIRKYDSQEAIEFKQAFIDNKVIVNHEDSHGGEGEGDQYWSVYSFTKGTEKVYVQFDGWYQSYNGSEYNEWFFVVPREVLVTQYFKEQ